MAKHRKSKKSRKHGRRRYSGLVSTTLGGLPMVTEVMNAWNGSVKASDVLVGGLIGVAATKGVSMLLKQAAGKFAIPQFVIDYTPLVGGAAAAGIIGVMDKRKGRGNGKVIGAMLAGVVPTAFELLAKHVPQLAGIESFKMNGFLVSDRMNAYGDDDYNGFLVSDGGAQRQLNAYADDPSMEDLAAVSMGDDDYDGIDALTGG